MCTKQLNTPNMVHQKNQSASPSSISPSGPAGQVVEWETFSITNIILHFVNSLKKKLSIHSNAVLLISGLGFVEVLEEHLSPNSNYFSVHH